MVRLTAFLLFLAISWVCWFVAGALCRSTVDGPDPAATPDYKPIVFGAVSAAAATCLVPFPLGFALQSVVWAIAAFGFLDLPPGRKAVLWAYLVAVSVVERLVVLGVLDL